MKIFLTGGPGVGKSTILSRVRKDFGGIKYGIVAREIRENGERIGFESVNVDGETSVFSHKFDIKSEHVVGGKYNVDVNAIEHFDVIELEKGLDDPMSLVFIDEIGRMQSFSSKFMSTVDHLLNSDANILATIVYDPEPWSIAFKEHPEVVLVEVTKENRDELPKLLNLIFDASDLYKQLSEKQKIMLREWMKKYFKEGKFMQIKKIFGNAIGYVVGEKVNSLGNGKYLVTGKTKPHELTVTKELVKCDCDLFNGKGEYVSNAGECSHIQAVKLFQAEN